MDSFLYLITPLLNDLKHPMERSLSNLCDNMNHMSELISEEVSFDFVKLK